jgi:hypothetical protein
MPFAMWRRFLNRKSVPVKPVSRTATRFRPGIEALEDRRLLSFALPVSYNVGTQPDPYIPNAAPISVATGDFNGDGKPDLVEAQTVDNSAYVLLGNGDGTFRPAVQDAVGESIEGCVFVADFNNDGKLDLFLPGNINTANHPIILLGKGDGTFQSRIDSSSFTVSGTYARGWAVGDFNGDGKLDVVATLPSNSADSGGYIVLPGNGDGTFQAGLVGPMVLHYVRWVTTGDFNRDGKLDLATADGQGRGTTTGTVELSILLGNGDGTFTLGGHYASPQAGTEDGTLNPEDVMAADLNGDGKLDVVVSNYSYNINVFLGRGDGTFQPAIGIVTGEYPRSVGAEDVNGDQKVDLVVTNVGINAGGAEFQNEGPQPGSVAVLLGQGNGTFQSPVQYSPFDYPGWTAVADFTGDGLPDLAVTRVRDGHSVNIMRNVDDAVQIPRFIQALYASALGRPASQADVGYWSGIFAQRGQGAVARGIEFSPEARTRLVQGWYVTFLGRAAAPPASEVQWWVNLLLAGNSEERVLSYILSTAEFYYRAQTLVSSGTSDERFVGALYRLLLNRTPGQSEVTSWVRLLPSVGRQGAALGFLKSTEYRGIMVRAYYSGLLHRSQPPSQSEVNFWVLSSLDLGSIRVLFESTQEYYFNS